MKEIPFDFRETRRLRAERALDSSAFGQPENRLFQLNFSQNMWRKRDALLFIFCGIETISTKNEEKAGLRNDLRNGLLQL